MTAPALEFAVAFAAPPERVFAALTEARHLQRWFCDLCESEPRVHGRLVMRWNRPNSSREPFEARWVEFESPARAAFQGGHAGYPAGDAGTVWYALAEEAGGTRLTVTHSLPALAGYEPMLEAWRSAWPRALARLQHYLAPVTEPGA